MTDLKQLNKDRIAQIKGTSHGLEILIDEIRQAQQFNATQPQVKRKWGYWNEGHRQLVTVYFTWVTDNRLMAHIIVDHQPRNGSTETISIHDGIVSGSIYTQPRLQRLIIPEAGHRLYEAYKDGYQANGGGYSKPFHILERMVTEAKKHIDVNAGVGHWQDFIKCEVIA
jgi:hypothetical protein